MTTADSNAPFALLKGHQYGRGRTGNPDPASWEVRAASRWTAASVFILRDHHPTKETRRDLCEVVSRHASAEEAEAAKSRAKAAWDAASPAVAEAQRPCQELYTAQREAKAEFERLQREAMAPLSEELRKAETARVMAARNAATGEG